MSSRTLPRSVRVTAASIVLAAATVVVAVTIVMATIPALMVGALTALAAGLAATMFLAEEIRNLRRCWARDRAHAARLAAERAQEQREAEAAFRTAMGQRLRANRAEIESLRSDLESGQAQIDELSERLATEQELAMWFGNRREIDPAIVSPTILVDNDEIGHLRSA